MVTLKPIFFPSKNSLKKIFVKKGSYVQFFLLGTEIVHKHGNIFLRPHNTMILSLWTIVVKELIFSLSFLYFNGFGASKIKVKIIPLLLMIAG